MEGAVLAKSKPATLILVRLRYVVPIVRGKVLPRVVSNNSQKSPRATFEVLHQHRSGRSVAGTVPWRRQNLLQILTMSRRGPKDRDHVNRSSTLALGVVGNSHRLGEFLPRRSVHERIIMPVAHIAHCWRDLKGRGLDRRLGAHMRDQAIIPRIAFLMAQKNEMPRHRV